MLAMPPRSRENVGRRRTDLDFGDAEAVAPLRVLCIEDDPAVRLWLRRVFTDVGWIARTAVDARRALRLVRGQAFDALIVDLRLPDTPGLELLRHLRAAGHTTPAIVLTGFPDAPTAIEARALGAGYFIKGAVRAEELVSAAGRIARRAAAEAATNDDPVHAALRTTLLAIDTERFGADATASALRHVAAALADSAVSIRSFVFGAATLRRLLAAGVVSRPEIDLIRMRMHQLRSANTAGSTLLDQVGQLVSGAGPGRRHLDLDRVATQIHVMPEVLRAALRTQVHLTWPRFRQAVIMRDAVRLLVLSDEQVAQIGYQLGYDHPSVFDREFRSTVGLSPTSYRRMARS